MAVVLLVPVCNKHALCTKEPGQSCITNSTPTSCYMSCTHMLLHMTQYLAAKGADLEAEDAQARLPLHHAAANEASIEALRYLVKHSTWLDAPDASDNTPLHLAARCALQWQVGAGLKQVWAGPVVGVMACLLCSKCRPPG